MAAGKPAIVIPPLVQALSPSEVEFAVRVDDSESAPAASVVLISGLPPDVTFSAGRAIVRGTWEVPLAAIAGLKVKVPADIKGRSDLVILLTHNSEKYTVVLASARSALVVDVAPGRAENATVAQIGEARKPAEARKAEEQQQIAEAKRAEEARLAEEAKKAEEARKLAEARKAEEEQRRIAEAKRAEEARLAEEPRRVAEAKKVTDERSAAETTRSVDASDQRPALKEPTASLSQDRLEHFVTQGDRHLVDGNVVVARQYYLRAAQAGMARAALRLAETYDPIELRRLNVQGLMPDVAEAKRWYERAVALGDAGAQVKLGRLSGN
ncbi:MAG TPA: hypothetical protein VFR19_18230 [Hyphomicrobiaceae bacterium]|nr:hypothetical protein [Hyphomicrobiaceae bacterium]